MRISAGIYGGYIRRPMTVAVRRQPYSVILFDEIEKAPPIFMCYLPNPDAGRLPHSKGRWWF